MSYFPTGMPSGVSRSVSPRPEAQDTDKGAKDSMARTGDDEPKIPRAIQDILDDLNIVRQRLSELWAKEYGAASSRVGSTRAMGAAYPAYSSEDLERRVERDKLNAQEDQLMAEFQEVKAAARIGPGGDINPATGSQPPEGA